MSRWVYLLAFIVIVGGFALVLYVVTHPADPNGPTTPVRERYQRKLQCEKVYNDCMRAPSRKDLGERRSP
jgi:hypothetical protein